MTLKPYYQDDQVTLYHGDCLEVLAGIDTVDLIVTDPPYGETALEWDRWPDGWPGLLTPHSSSMWCFGSMRMFLDQRNEFAAWRMSQDVVWEKHSGTGLACDRFSRVHEHAVHWYQGNWSDVYHETPRLHVGNLRRSSTKPAGSPRGEHLGNTNGGMAAAWLDDGTRLVNSVFRIHGMHKRGDHPTEKPTGVLEPLIGYGCPPGGTVLDPFAGSGSTLAAAKATGRHGIGIEANERYCEIAARRLAQDTLFGATT